MFGSRQMAKIVAEVARGGAKLVLVGDPQQLQAIEAGAAFRAITEQAHYVELTEVRRQREPWQQE
jgi:ATP-dependent exoDNAse (exonuclease V) alpha subunit